MRRWLLWGLAVVLAGCGGEGWRQDSSEFEPEIPNLPADPAHYAPLDGYSEMDLPKDNPMTPEKVALGWQLFFDPRLSGDGKRSCYSCHLNDKGLADGVALNKGAFEKPLSRHTPTLWNIGYHQKWYWDGRADTLERQAKAAWTGVNMGASKPEEIVRKLNDIPGYRRQFEKVFGGPATPDNVPMALAAYMRTIISRDTPYDRWRRGDRNAMSEAAQRGLKVFEKAGCANCHSGLLFTDLQFHNVGIGMRAEKPDLGRYNQTKNDRDRGAFKTPTLRDVVDSAPYFHDGSVATLEEAVKIMAGGGIENEWLDRANLKKADLTEEEFRDLLEFLKALDEPAALKEPKLPPDR